MTREEKIKVLAELDGQLDWRRCLRLYLTSYDAIIPLIQKQDNDVFGFMLQYITEELALQVWEATPEQLCDALIKAVGKCKD